MKRRTSYLAAGIEIVALRAQRGRGEEEEKEGSEWDLSSERFAGSHLHSVLCVLGVVCFTHVAQ